MNSESRDTDPKIAPVIKKAGVRQVAATMLWGLCMIGKKGTWEKDGATITFLQAIIGAVITGIAIVFILVMIVKFVV